MAQQNAWQVIALTMSTLADDLIPAGLVAECQRTTVGAVADIIVQGAE
jgi:hypothetical protein